MFDLSSAAIIYNKAVVRQVKINANLEDQEITISQASALLPGSTDLGLQGIIFAKPETKIPQFEGTTDFTTNNLRTLLNWLGVKPPEVPYNRLRRLTVSGKIFANMKKLAFKNIKGKIDDTKITGRISTTINERPLLNINLAANHLNLDGYFLSHKTEGSGSKTTIIKNEGVGSVPSKSLKSKNINSEGKFAELSKVGVNLRISLGKLIVGNLPIKKTILTGKLENSKLIISNLEFDDLAGISAKVGGEILNIDETNNRIPPKFKDFSFNFYTKDLNRALDFLEIKKLAIEKKIGKASLSGKLTGDYEKMGIKADLSLLGGRWGYNGLVESLIGNPSFKAKVSMSHPSLSNLLLKLDNNYQLKNKRSDPINITSNITGSLKKIKFSDLLGKVRDIKISGNIIADLKEPIPVMDVDLKTGNIIFDDFLPIQYQTLFDKHITKYENYVSEIISNKPKIIRASYSTSPKTIKTRLIAGKLGQRKSKSGLPWRKNAIDISVIKKFGGDIKLQAESLQFKKHRINSINTSITVNDNVMSIKHLTGNAYDGTIELDGQLLAAKAVDKFKTRFKVVNVNTAKLLDTIGTRGFRRGALDITGEFNSSGRLTLDHINTLNGMGVISVRGLEFLSGNKKNTTMSGFGGLFLSIDKFSNTILGNNIVSKRTNFNTSFIADNGVVRFEDMSLKTGLGSGTAKGLIDLPKWKIVTSGEIKLSQNILSQILVKQPSKPIYLPFSIKGRLDNPSMKLKTSEITKIGIRLPNIFENKIDRISKKKGIDNLLEKVLPKVKIMNKRIGESEVDSKHPDKRQSPLNNKIKTHDFLKNILRELTN
jgi:hypothetical protein